MIESVKVTYKKQWVEVPAKYACKGCGNKFYRKNRDWFTVNPLSTDDYNTARNKKRKEQEQRVRPCPKCGADVKPT